MGLSGEEETMKWGRAKDRYDLPGDLDAIDWATVVLLGFAIALWMVALWAAR